MKRTRALQCRSSDQISEQVWGAVIPLMDTLMPF